MLGWEAALHVESRPWYAEAAAAASKEGPVEQKNRQIENRHTDEEDVID